MLQPDPQLLPSMKQCNKREWQCAAISNNYLVAANLETCLLWKLEYSKVVDIAKIQIDPPKCISCLAIQEDTTSQEVLVAIGLRNREGRDNQEVQVHRINCNTKNPIPLRQISLTGIDPRMLSFSPDGTLLACTVCGYKRDSQEQYCEQVIVHRIENPSSTSSVPIISINFMDVSAWRYPISAFDLLNGLP